MTPEVRRFFFAPAPLIITKANVMSRVHRRAHMDYIGVKTYRADGSPKGEIRLVGLFTSQAYVRPPSQIPFLRHKVDTVLAASGYPPGQPRRQGAAQHPRHLPPRRAVPDRHRAAAGVDRGHPRSGDAAARAGVRAHRPLRPVRVGARLCAARPLHDAACASASARCWRTPTDGRIAAFYPYFPEGPLVRVQFIVARFGGETPQADVCRARAQDRRDRAHLGGPPGRRHLPREASDARRRCSPSTARPSRPATPRPSRPSGRWRTSSASSGSGPSSRSSSISTASRARRRAASTPPSIRWARRSALSERVPVLENLGFSAIDERSYHIRPRFADGERDVTLHDMVLETERRRAASIWSGTTSGSRAASSPCCAATPTTTASTA